LVAARADAGVGPPIAIGASGEHEAFAGTLSIGTPALEAVIVELGRSALPPAGSSRPRPFRAVLFVNGHGGNVEALARATALLVAESRDVAVWHPQVPGGDSHAGRTETSMMLHLDPEAVRVDRIEPGSTARWREIGETVRTAGLAAVTSNGVLGDPTAADPAHGAEVFAALADELREFAGRRWG
jgi:creatinine amidohydrolase